MVGVTAGRPGEKLASVAQVTVTLGPQARRTFPSAEAEMSARALKWEEVGVSMGLGRAEVGDSSVLSKKKRSERSKLRVILYFPSGFVGTTRSGIERLKRGEPGGVSNWVLGI